MKINASSMLKAMFIFGALLDGAIAVSWFLIASGLAIPNILNGYMGAGADYQLAMYYGAMFMTGWAVLLAWGAFRPIERKGLLLITAGFLCLSVLIELVYFENMLEGLGFVLGAAKRLFVSMLFAASYFYTLRSNAN